MRAAGWIDKTDADGALRIRADKCWTRLRRRPTSLSCPVRPTVSLRRRNEPREVGSRRPPIPLIDAAVKLIGEGQWITYSDIATLSGPTPLPWVSTSPATRWDSTATIALSRSGDRPTGRNGGRRSRPRVSVSTSEACPIHGAGSLPRTCGKKWTFSDSFPTSRAGPGWSAATTSTGADLVPTWLARRQVSLAATNLRSGRAGHHAGRAQADRRRGLRPRVVRRQGREARRVPRLPDPDAGRPPRRHRRSGPALRRRRRRPRRRYQRVCGGRLQPRREVDWAEGTTASTTPTCPPSSRPASRSSATSST